MSQQLEEQLNQQNKQNEQKNSQEDNLSQGNLSTLVNTDSQTTPVNPNQATYSNITLTLPQSSTQSEVEASAQPIFSEASILREHLAAIQKGLLIMELIKVLLGKLSNFC